jgi:segregation and condensation protein B
MSSDLAKRAHAFLFAEGGSLTLKKLSQLLESNPEALNAALDELSASLQGSGIALVRTETEVALVIAADARDAVADAYEHELGREVGEAGLEVLAILLYRGGSTRAHIDYIRGVNSTSTLRSLLARGLVERAGNPSDSREYVYRPTVELLVHLGVTQTRDLPEYATIVSELAVFEANIKANGLFDDPEHGTTDTNDEPTGNPGNY